MVVIVPAVEGLPPRSMQDFILTLSEVRAQGSKVLRDQVVGLRHIQSHGSMCSHDQM